LNDDDIKMYGATFRKPKGYNKLELLGRGGCAVVWKCESAQTGQLFAVKQFPKCKGNEANVKNVKEEMRIN
jgi:serine/threonine protein kinase